MRTAGKVAIGGIGLAVAAAVVIPNLLSAKVNWNDSAAMAMLRTLHGVQEEFAGRCLVDVDGDRKGEFATMGELAGAAGLRTDATGGKRSTPLVPPLLSPSLANLDDGGVVVRSGCCFRIQLPGRNGGASRERGPGAPLAAPVDSDAAESRWGAYAWPVEKWAVLEGEARRHAKALWTDGSGRVWFTWNGDFRYAGPAGGPSWDAAMPEDGWGGGWTDPPPGVEEYRGRDGNIWRDIETLYRR